MPRYPPTEAKRRKLAYRQHQVARMRVQPVTYTHPLILGIPVTVVTSRITPCANTCGNCLARRFQALPEELRIRIIKRISTAENIIKFEDSTLIIDGVKLIREGTTSEVNQLLLAKRFGVVKEYKLIAYELYHDEAGHTKARLLNIEQLVHIMKLIGSMRLHQ